MGERKNSPIKINTYIMTIISRRPRQILAFEIGSTVNAKDIQKLVDRSPQAKNYYTDGEASYLGVDYFTGKHKPNVNNKKDTHIVESTNSDIRRYIAGFQRKSKCFFRKIETMQAVLCIFINAYNKFGEEKYLWHKAHPNWKDYQGDYGCSHADFI